jgi:hypothetical protein
MAWHLADFSGSKEEEIARIREVLQGQSALKNYEIRALIALNGRLKWDLIEVAVEMGKIDLRKVGRFTSLELFALAVIEQMPISLLLRVFQPLPQGQLPLSRFTTLHLIVNSTYPMVEKRIFLCKAVRISRTLLMIRDSVGRTPITYCKDKRLRAQMMALVTKAAFLWVKLHSIRLVRVPISVIRLIASEYI